MTNSVLALEQVVKSGHQSVPLLNVHRDFHVVGLQIKTLELRLAYQVSLRVQRWMYLGRVSRMGLHPAWYLEEKERYIMSTCNRRFWNAFDGYRDSRINPSPPLTPTPGYWSD